MTDAPIKSMRVAAGLSLRDVEALLAKRGIKSNSGRISLIERGVVGYDKERAAILAILADELAQQAGA